MTEVVWVGDGDDQAWAVGGTHQAVRLIRLLVERWDRAALGEQEAIIGRSKVSGAQLGLRREEADPAYDDDSPGRATRRRRVSGSCGRGVLPGAEDADDWLGRSLLDA